MAKPTARTGTSPFAHLLAVTGLARGKRAEEETPIDDEGPSNEDDAEDTEEPLEDVEEGGDSKKGRKAKGKAAAEDDDDQDAEADASDDDDEDEDKKDDKEASAYRAGLAVGRARENARCARIFKSKAAAGRPDLAATLAFTTRNTSAEAGRLMNAVGAAPAPRARSLSDRMDGRAEARPGAGGGGGKPSFADRLAAAKKKVAGHS